ncbi:hypothetical protein EV122DRAFT_294803 [Schizophyllum commune]
MHDERLIANSAPTQSDLYPAYSIVPEITRIWRRPKTRGSYLFLLNRYFGFFGGVTVTVLNFCAMPKETCQSVNLFREIYIVVTQIIVSMLMLIRVYAVFSRDRRVLAGLLSYAAVGIALAGWALFGQSSAAEPAVVKCLVYTPEADQPSSLLSTVLLKGLSVIWLTMLAYDLIVFVLTAGKTAWAVRQPRAPPLISILLRDGTSVLLVSNLANILTYYPYLKGTLATAVSSLSITLLSRMMLNLHGEAAVGIFSTADETTRFTTVAWTEGVATSRMDPYGTNGMGVYGVGSRWARSSGDEGLSARMELAGLVAQSVLMGVYAALVMAMIFLLSRRSTPKTAGRANRQARLWLIAGMVVLSIAALGQWTCIIVRCFKAFVFWEGGTHASWFYYSDTGASEVTRSAFHSATIVVADMFVISRLWVVYGHQRRVIIVPAITLAGLAVSALGTAHAYATYDALEPDSLKALHFWKMAQLAWTIRFGMIIWRIGRAHWRTPEFALGTSIMRAPRCTRMRVFSGFFLSTNAMRSTSSVVLAYQVSYGVNHVSSYFIYDCIPPAAALAAVLVHARAILTRQQEEASKDASSSELAESNRSEVRLRRASQISTLDECSLPPPGKSNITWSDLGSVRSAACPRPPCRLALLQISLYTNLLAPGAAAPLRK